MMICKTCNKYIPDDSKFCPYCGSNNLGNDEFSKSAGFISKTISKAAKIKEVSAHPTNPVECCADANPKTMLPNDT